MREMDKYAGMVPLPGMQCDKYTMDTFDNEVRQCVLPAGHEDAHAAPVDGDKWYYWSRWYA